MFAIIRTRWQTRPLSRRAKRRSSTAPGSLRKKYAGIVYPPNMVRSPAQSTTSGNYRKPVLGHSAAKAPAAQPPPLIEKIKFAPDSPLEEAGFELMVPSSEG